MNLKKNIIMNINFNISKKKCFEFIWYLIIIAGYLNYCVKPFIRMLESPNVEKLYLCCISEMFYFSSDISYGIGKGYKPGYEYFGSAYRTKLNIDHRYNANFIDPFYPGIYTDWISINFPTVRNHRTYKMKGGLLKYYTDGKSIAVIISAGPDGVYEKIDYTGSESFFKIVLYDPTNGLYSRGDIIMIKGKDEYFPVYGNYSIKF